MEKTNQNEILPDVKNIKSRETYTLPSKGLVCSEADNIPASLTLRRMTTKEEKIRIRNEGEDRIRRDLLQACILEPINADNLKIEDANYLLFQLRIISLIDDTYKIVCRCPSCKTEFVHKINLSEVPITFLNADSLSLFDATLPICGAQIKYKLPSIGDIIHMGDTIKEYISNFPNIDRNELLYTLSSILYIDTINGHTLLQEELEQYLDNLDILDTRKMKETIHKLDGLYGYQTELKTKCPNCGMEISHGLPITSELFNPSN